MRFEAPKVRSAATHGAAQLTKVKCPNCEQRYSIKDSQFGVEIPCRKCKHPMRFEAPKSGQAAAKQTATKQPTSKQTAVKLARVKCPVCAEQYRIKESQFGVAIPCRVCESPMRFSASDIVTTAEDTPISNAQPQQAIAQPEASNESMQRPESPADAEQGIDVGAPKKKLSATLKASSKRRFRRQVATFFFVLIAVGGAGAGVYSYLEMVALKNAVAENETKDPTAEPASPKLVNEQPVDKETVDDNPDSGEPVTAETASSETATEMPPETDTVSAEPSAPEVPDASENPDASDVEPTADLEPEPPTVDVGQQDVGELGVAFVNIVVPFFDQHCTRCHGPNRESGDMRVDLLKASVDDEYTLSHLQNIIDEMTGENMPPAKQPQPDPQEVSEVVEILTALGNAAKAEHDVGGGRPVRRLTRTEYVNTVKDLLGVRVDADGLPDDLIVGAFETNAENLFLTDMHIRLYLEKSREAVKQFIKDRSSESNAQAYNFFAQFLENGDGASVSSASLMIRKFSTLVKRGRKPDSTYVDRLTGVFRMGRRQGMPFWEAIEEPLANCMCSIDSLMLFEDRDPERETRTVSGTELANRLSYALWRSAPDEELLALGESGALLDVKTRAQQIKRMMADEKAERFLNDFTDQWFELPRQDEIAVDLRVYKNFDLNVKPAMKQETVQFMAHVVRENLSITNLIDSDFMMLNDAMARHYGIDGVEGSEFRPVERQGNSADEIRGGILTHAGILMQGGTGDRTSIVERGAFVARKIIDNPPGVPPPDVGELPTTEAETAKMTGAELVSLHAKSPQCANCHAKIDPLGIGLEGFDAVGLYRTEEIRLNPLLHQMEKAQRRNPKNHVISVPIDQRGRLYKGKKFEGVAEMKQVLMTKKMDLAKGFVKALLAYTNGREASLADTAIVDRIVKQTVANDFPARTIIEKVMASKVMTGY